MKAQGPYSTKLLRYIEDHRDNFDLFIFYTYLYATSYFGLPLVSDKAFLVPFAHDEWPIHLSMWDPFFGRPRGIIYSTPEEREFLAARFAGAPAGPIIGVGISPPSDISAHHFRAQFGIAEPYAVYVGRIDPAKGCDALLADFATFKRWTNDDFSLVLLGRESMPLPRLAGVHALGYVDERTKFDALAASDFLVMPSALESLSIALLEAWSVGRPVLVNAASDVLVGQCRRAGGGLWYGDAADFAAAAHVLRSKTGSALGASGKRFVEERYTWPSVVAAYEAAYAGRSAAGAR
jgi:glycosyltransferase involved in cell wall biosynthesis